MLVFENNRDFLFYFFLLKVIIYKVTEILKRYWACQARTWKIVLGHLYTSHHHHILGDVLAETHSS